MHRSELPRRIDVQAIEEGAVESSTIGSPPINCLPQDDRLPQKQHRNFCTPGPKSERLDHEGVRSNHPDQ